MRQGRSPEVVDEVWVVQRHHGPFNQHPRQNLREKGLVGLPEKDRPMVSWDFSACRGGADSFVSPAPFGMFWETLTLDMSVFGVCEICQYRW